ncbi:MAG: zinc ABC transporter substrate-binding protein [Candidatus Pacebacteria bacterium]|jgi:zinc transport system substrate-binding protein|nr:zinc ABC transporter substrate-binding protein [Candidatus Paceibacterota bacterium]
MLVITSNRKLVIVVTVLILGVLLTFLVLTRGRQAEPANGRIHIVSSFYPLSYAAEKVGGNLVLVNTLVPAGVEPHDFEPSPRDFVDIGKADILVFNGAALEPWVKKWQEGSTVRPKEVIDMAQTLKARGVVLGERDGAVDPHFWLNPIIMKSEIEAMRDIFSQIDPAHKDIFIENATRALISLDDLDQRFRTGLASCSLHDIVVLHEAFNYLGRQYGITVTSIEGISPDEEPSPKDLAHIVALARDRGVKSIFFETVASPKFSELVAREIGGTTLVLNPLESLTPDEVQSGEDYVSVMEMNLNNLQKAMSCATN